MIRRSPRSSLGLTLGCALAATACSNPGPEDRPLTVQTFTSSAEPIAVNSHLILGDTEAVLVDAQLFRADAQSAVALVNASGKKLKAIFLTHAHPDHYAGLEVLKNAFPSASILTTKEVLDDFNKVAPGTFAFLKSSYGNVIADNLVTPTVASGDTLTVDGKEIKILRLSGGEAEVSAALIVPSLGAVFAGDHLYGGTHLFIGGCDTDGWQRNLTSLRGVSGAMKYYPGHGSAGAAELLDQNSQYIKDARPILDSGKKIDDVIAGLKQKYPTLTATGLLPLSVPRYLAACGPSLELPGAAYYPESLHAAADGAIYVGSLATGEVRKFASGSTQSTSFVPAGGAGAIKGVTGVLVDDTGGWLWLCAVDPTFTDPTKNGLRRFKLSDGTLSASIALAGGGANICNDMTLDAMGNLYVADSMGKIHKIAKNATTSTVWSSDTLLAPSSPMGFGADGITFDGTSNLYVNTFTDGRLLRIPINGDGTAGKAVAITVTPKLESPDGMRQIDATTLLVVESSRLSKVTISGTTATASALQTGLDGPTAVARAGGKLYVAEGQLGHLFGFIPGPPNMPFKVRVFPAE